MTGSRVQNPDSEHFSRNAIFFARQVMRTRKRGFCLSELNRLLPKLEASDTSRLLATAVCRWAQSEMDEDAVHAERWMQVARALDYLIAANENEAMK
ncbi:hypothetical protein [Breoghania sp.]|uniref:hypothetical protein n=1 Tax=Breoghania sp. TaxID=2065378 RepID=UPI002AA7314F|nr:hypothetical protein [Breoghania sp.]